MLEPLLQQYYPWYVLALQVLISVFVALSTLVSLDRILCIAKYAVVKVKSLVTGKLPQHSWNYRPLPNDSQNYPTVAIQLPMFNERAVCQAIIDCCCELSWEPTKFHVQVLDDSTDSKTRELVDEQVALWKERGVSISCLRRTNRQGYKAGAMKEGMDILSKQGYKYVAVFDADFKPQPDFLMRTIPYLEGNPNVGYVQTRWTFTNPGESYLTKAQEVSLNYHMKCEQLTHSATGSFFNFNGTAGVWRLHCIEDAGGWLSRTTVEDMDLSLRAYIKGWKAIFLNDVTCLNEIPASFFAFRKQQHRWTCGPAQLWIKAHKDIWSSDLSLFRKLELTIMYFGVRKCATHFVALGFFCSLVPLSIITPEVSVPTWALVQLPVVVTLSTAAFTESGWAYSILYVLFENAMGMVKLWAVVTALLDLQRAQEWVVTTKLGSSDKRPGATTLMPSCKVYGGELLFGLFLTSLATVGLMQATGHWGLASYFLVQGLVFVAFGFNMVDVGGLLGGRVDGTILHIGEAARETTATTRDMVRQTTMPVVHLASVPSDSFDKLRPADSSPPKFRSQYRPSMDGIGFIHPFAKPRSDDGSLDSSNNDSDGTDETAYSMSSSQLSGIQSVLPVSPSHQSMAKLQGSPDSKLNVYIEGSEVKPRKGYRNSEGLMNIEVV
jgi:beta-mannan synthase